MQQSQAEQLTEGTCSVRLPSEVADIESLVSCIKTHSQTSDTDDVAGLRAAMARKSPAAAVAGQQGGTAVEQQDMPHASGGAGHRCQPASGPSNCSSSSCTATLLQQPCDELPVPLAADSSSLPGSTKPQSMPPLSIEHMPDAQEVKQLPSWKQIRRLHEVNC